MQHLKINKLLEAISDGLHMGLEIADDFEDADINYNKETFNNRDSRTTYIISEMLFKSYGIYPICNYEFKCQGFNTIDFCDQQKTGYYSYVNSDGYLEIHYINGIFDKVHLNFANAAKFYNWKVYNKKGIDEFTKEYIYCKNVVDKMKAQIAYVTPDKAMAIIDNHTYILIMPTYAEIFQNNIDKLYGNAPEFDFKSPLIKALKSSKISASKLINDYHLLPITNSDLEFQLKCAKSFAKYMKIDKFKSDLLKNPLIQIKQLDETTCIASGIEQYEDLYIQIYTTSDSCSCIIKLEKS